MGLLINRRIIASIVLLFAAFTSIAYAAWSTQTRLTTNTVEDIVRELTLENDNLHMVSEQLSSIFETKRTIFYRTKPSTSNSWKSPVKISGNAAHKSTIAVYKGKAYIAFDFNDGNDDEIALKTNKSGSWPSSPTKITNNGYEDSFPSIAQENGKLYLVFMRKSKSATSDNEIYFTKNLSGSWATPKALTDNSIEDADANIFVKDGKVYVVWTTLNYETFATSIKYRTFSNNKWSSIQTIASNSNPGALLAAPSIILYNSKPCITYTKMSFFGGSGGICFTYRSSGKWIKKDITNNTSDQVGDVLSRFSTNSGKIVVAFTRSSVINSDTHSDIWLASINSLSGTWSKTNLTSTQNKDEAVAGVVIDSNVKRHVVYSYDDGDQELFYKKEQ